jgi:CubicO group peptidase (beta-lactamase class C family)
MRHHWRWSADPMFRLRSIALAIAAMFCLACISALRAQPNHPSALMQELDIAPPGQSSQSVSLDQAMRALNIPSVGISLIDNGKIAWTTVVGDQAAGTLFQAASVSKFVTAIAVMRLVQAGRLDLDLGVNAYLTSWRLPETSRAENGKVTLRRLLSMTAGINVPGYLGYLPGATLPTLSEILNGSPPANSPPVTIMTPPGSTYAYSGGGYEIIEAIVEDVTGQPFATAMKTLVLEPAGMRDSVFLQPLPQHLIARAATGHTRDGRVCPGGWRVIPELAAGGLWSTPNDLAQLLISFIQDIDGTNAPWLSKDAVRTMLARQPPGHYGLGAAVSGEGESLVLMKRGQNIGYQSFLILFPFLGKGMVVMTNSDNGTTLANALVRRAGQVYRWPAVAELMD